MARQVSKPNIFWAPSLETARKIDDEDTVKSIETARYRFAASMADLERCYDEQASRLRAAFVAEVRALPRRSRIIPSPCRVPGRGFSRNLEEHMSKIIDAEDILNEAQNCVECIYMAAMDLSREQTNPIQVVADIASKKIEEAIALLDEYCTDMGAGPEPDAPGAKPVSAAARTKRKGK
jgi:hypothetical protein